MKICHLTSVHVPFDTRIFHRECRSLADAGHEVHLVARHTVDETVDGIRIHAVTGYAGKMKRIVAAPREVLRRALEDRYDVYHFHDPELIPVGVLLKRRGLTVIYDVHEDYPVYFRHKAAFPRPLRRPFAAAISVIERFTAGLFDAVVTVTPNINERFLRLNDRTVLVRNFTDAAELADCSGKTAWNERDDAVAYVGSLTLDRGVEEMVEAVGRAAVKTPVRFLLAGDFVSRDDEKTIRRLPGWKHVDFQGRTNRTETAALLRRAKAGLVVCHPQSNYMRAYPTKLFEYMAAGIPVVVSDFPLWRGIVGSAGCGLMVDPLDTKAISEAVVRLLEHPREAEEMGRRGREAVLDRYNWDNEEKTLLDLYGTLGRERNSP